VSDHPCGSEVSAQAGASVIRWLFRGVASSNGLSTYGGRVHPSARPVRPISEILAAMAGVQSRSVKAVSGHPRKATRAKQPIATT
jgi:hypothetical protein